jgi:hypothetical protein
LHAALEIKFVAIGTDRAPFAATGQPPFHAQATFSLPTWANELKSLS